MAQVDKLQAELIAIASMPPAQLRQYWAGLSENDLPQASPSLLRHLIAHRLQEKAHGNLPTHIERELDKLGRTNGANLSALPQVRGPILPGTRFVREWNGKTIAVTATDSGFEWNEDTYRSLSEIARKVTGAHWSGPRFFGLTGKGH
jgi:hypothetical protein